MHFTLIGYAFFCAKCSSHVAERMGVPLSLQADGSVSPMPGPLGQIGATITRSCPRCGGEELRRRGYCREHDDCQKAPELGLACAQSRTEG